MDKKTNFYFELRALAVDEKDLNNAITENETLNLCRQTLQIAQKKHMQAEKDKNLGILTNEECERIKLINRKICWFLDDRIKTYKKNNEWSKKNFGV